VYRRVFNLSDLIFSTEVERKIMNIIRTRCGRKVISLAAIAVITLAFTTIPAGRSASAAEPSEQVIFSGEGVTTDGLEVGFWIWCMSEGNSPQYTGACRGSVLIHGQGPASGVAGFVVENPDGTYVARVFSINANTFLIAAAFHNVDPEPSIGPTNLVQFGVLTPNGNTVGVSPNAVVRVTGPGEE
jgi:V8-like Glu-specific endopeptidase